MVLWGLAVLAAFVVVAALVATGSWKAWRRFELWRDHRRIEASCWSATADWQNTALSQGAVQLYTLCNYIRTASLCCAACCFLQIRLWAGPKAASQEVCSTSTLLLHLQSCLGVSLQTADLDEEADDTLDLETIELINLVRAAVAVSWQHQSWHLPRDPTVMCTIVAGCLDATLLSCQS
jgi:hypothetical protein